MTDALIDVPTATATGEGKVPTVIAGTGAVISVPVATATAAAAAPSYLLYPVIEFIDSIELRANTILFGDIYPGRESQTRTISIINTNPTTDLDVTITSLIGSLGSELDTVKSTLISPDDASYTVETDTITALAASETPVYLKWHPPSTAKIGEKEWKLHLDIEGFTPPTVTGWSYYGKLPVYGTVDGELTDYQVEKRIYYHPDMNSDFTDLRFYLADGTELSYGIIEQVAGVYVDCGILIPTIPVSPGSVDIYTFCGNTSAEDVTDPDTVYSFYDDMTGTYSDKWTSGGEYAVYSGRNSLVVTTDDNIRAVDFTLTRPFEYKFDFLMATNSNIYVEYLLAAGDDLYDKYHILLNGDGTYYIRKNYGGLKSGYYSFLAGWNTFKMTLDSSGVHTFYLNNDPAFTVTDTTYSSGLLGFDIYSLYARTTYISKLRVSQYTPTPPIVGELLGWNLNSDITIKGKVLYQEQDLPGYTPVIRYGCRVGGELYE